MSSAEVVLGAVVPHPPLLIPRVGGRDVAAVRDTQEAMRALAGVVKKENPEALVFLSPHSPVFQDAVAINFNPELKGDFGDFRAPEVSLSRKNDLDLAREIKAELERRGVTTASLTTDITRFYGVGTGLDHGVLVPLYYLDEAGVGCPVVSLAMAFLPNMFLYRVGMAIREAALNLGRRVAIIASGDLSHRLTPDAPAGYEPRGKEFDAEIIRFLGRGDVEGIMFMDETLKEKAGECGYRTIVMMMGAFDGRQVEAKTLSYERPFGVGYGVAIWEPGPEDAQRRFLDKWEQEHREKMSGIRNKESFPVSLARRTVEEYIRSGKIISTPQDIPPGFRGRAGVFVTIKKHGQLRGCIGTILPTQERLADEIIHNAIDSSTGDPRFDPVEPEELPDLVYSVDVLGAPEPVPDMSHLDPKRYGVIVTSGHRRGLLLPDLEGIDTVEEQVAIARQKAGIGPEEPVTLERFEVVRYS